MMRTYGSKPPLRLGPLDSTEPPRAPDLICTGTAPTANDSWLVLNGTVNHAHRAPVTVTASLPGWTNSKDRWFEVK